MRFTLIPSAAVVIVVVPTEKNRSRNDENWLFENRLSLETCGRLSDFVTPREVNNCDTEYDVINAKV